MSGKKYNILEDTFCLYCQEDFGTPKKLQDHIHMKHPGTYADHSIKEANVKS